MLMSSNEGGLYLDEFMTESRSTMDGTTTVNTSDSDLTKNLVCQFYVPIMNDR